MLYEISRKRITINKYEDTSMSWHNSVLVVRGNKTLHLIDFSYNLSSLEKEIDLKECTISASYDSPVPNNYLSNYAAQGINNLELVEMITNPAFWPHNKLLTQELTNIVAFKWSPVNFINNYESVLATVNSVGNIELFSCKNQLWYSIMDFSQEMMKHLSLRVKLLDQCPQGFKDVEKVVYSLETSMLCWSPELNTDGSCYLATAQKSGEILYWSIKCNRNNVDTEFLGSVKNSNKDEITLMNFIPIKTNIFFLVSANEKGQLFGNECEISDNNVSLIQEYILWPNEDKMFVTYMEYTFVKDKLLIFFNKHRHLIVQMYDKTFKLVSQSVTNVNDYRITCIKKCNDIFYVSTINTNVYKVNYSITEGSMDVELKSLNIKDSYTSCELFGLGSSSNNVLFALAMIDRKVFFRKESLKIDIIFLSPELELDVQALAIVNNPLKKLTNMWDHLEIVRCKIIKTKTLPQIDYNKLLQEGENDVYKLKVYLVFLFFYRSLESLMTQLKGTLPETSINVIKDRILFHQSIRVINDIYNKKNKNIILSDLEMESFDFSKKFVNYYCEMYSKNRNDYVSDDIWSISYLNVEYTCQACDEKLLQFTCKYGHLNMFCVLTFSPIESDQYMVCRSCSSTARIELYKQKPTCVFCDLYLNSV